MGRLRKIAEKVTAKERAFYREGELGPGVSDRAITLLPKIKAPQVWEFSAHPHYAERAKLHTDIRLGNPETGIAHSFVLPKRTELPEPGKSALVIPTYDHSIPYMDYTGRISTAYGKGKVVKGRRTQADVYHSTPDDKPGTKLRFNLYDGSNPEEFSIIQTGDRLWRIVNKTLTRERRPDLPAEKPKYKEVDVEKVDPGMPGQVMMPKLDGAHGIIDLQAGRAPRVFSYRTAKKAPTGLIEHTHKLTDLLKDKVPKSLDGTVLRGEILATNQKGKALPAETIGGMLNAKVWASRAKQEELGAKLHAFPFDVVKYKGKPMSDAPFSEKLKVLKEVEKEIGDLWLPELAATPKEKSKLLKKIEEGKHPLTREGVVLVEPEKPGAPTKAKFAPDFDVFVRGVHPAVSGETGKPHDRAGSVSYSWTEDGPIVGQVGGFSHELGKAMLKNPDKYVGRVAKVKATKVFGTERGQPGALFQPRFKGWHLEKGEIEKAARVVNITTHDSKGQEHTRPFSFVNQVAGSKPPELGITMLKPGGQTLRNAKATGELKVDSKPHTVTKLQDAEVVFAKEKAAFLDELQKIADTDGMSPAAAAGAAASGKILLSNFLSRHGLDLPPIRRLVEETMGTGYRTAMQGKPMLPWVVREALALTTDANLVRAYEMAYSAGQAARSAGPEAVEVAPELARMAQQYGAEAGVPKSLVKLLANIPMESTGARRVIDYALSPPSQIGRDILGAAKRLIRK